MDEAGCAIGIDIGATNLRAGRVSATGDILARAAEPIVRDPSAVLSRLLALCARLDDGTVRAIGIGVPGRVDVRTRRVFSGGYLDLAGADLAAQVERALGRPVMVDNDGTMALLGELAAGAAKGCDDVAMFTIGTGIGGAVALGGRIARGRATGGQLGHLTVQLDGLPCACGRRGCVETTSSGTALGRLIAEAGLPAGTTAAALFDREAAGEVRMRRLLETWAAPLRAAIDSVAAALDPELVVIGGGLGDAACRALARIPAASSWFQTSVVPARLGDDAGLVGAAMSALAQRVARPRAPRRAAVEAGLAR